GRPLRFCRSSRTYADAEAICADANMRLVSIASEADWDDVYGRARRRFGDAAFWIGLDDIDDEGTYVWSDGRTWQVGDDEPYERFAGGEPNNYPSAQAVPGEDCIHTTGDRWNDNVCEAGFSVICEPR
ncbi:MAG TPA: C-type lectin domain-containing protein, partial [Myxococcota bacterium]